MCVGDRAERISTKKQAVIHWKKFPVVIHAGDHLRHLGNAFLSHKAYSPLTKLMHLIRQSDQVYVEAWLMNPICRSNACLDSRWYLQEFSFLLMVCRGLFVQDALRGVDGRRNRGYLSIYEQSMDKFGIEFWIQTPSRFKLRLWREMSNQQEFYRLCCSGVSLDAHSYACMMTKKSLMNANVDVNSNYTRINPHEAFVGGHPHYIGSKFTAFCKHILHTIKVNKGFKVQPDEVDKATVRRRPVTLPQTGTCKNLCC